MSNKSIVGRSFWYRTLLAVFIVGFTLFAGCENPAAPGDSGDKRALRSAIGAAKTARDAIAAIAVSADGKDVLIGTPWVTLSANADYNTAIAAAQAVADNASSTQAAIDTAIADLAFATAVFVAAQHSTGLAIAIPDKATFAKIGVDPAYPMTGNYKQTANIDMSGGNWTPIGGATVATAFLGTFDGGGYTISNLNIIGNGYQGLFGYVGSTTVSVTLKNIHIVSGLVISTATMNGGIAAWLAGPSPSGNGSSIINCSNAATINGTGTVGGICGNVSIYCKIIDCTNDGTIVCSTAGTGGIAGVLSGQYIVVTGCRNNGTILGTTGVGGIFGSSSNTSEVIKDCVNTGSVTGIYAGGNIVGGIAGTGGTNVYVACYNTGAVTARNTYTTATLTAAGGIVGTTGGTITACYNTGAVTAEGNFAATNSAPLAAGGIRGNVAAAGSITTACYNTGKVTSVGTGGAVFDLAGGIIGYYNVSAATIPSTISVGNYWKKDAGGTATVGVAGGKTGASLVAGGNIGSPEFSGSDWPNTTTSPQWGTGDGSGSEKYWKSLGAWNGGTPTYPKLWFES